MSNLTTYSRHPQDEPVLQQLETYLQHLSSDNKATIAIAALYQATDPRFVYCNYIYNRYPKLNKSIALLQKLSLAGKLALARAILEELAVLDRAIAGGNPVIPQVCPFCKSSVSLVDSAKIYHRSYGSIYLCDSYPRCDARVGCHSGSDKPLGTLADRELRQWRSLAHRHFDPLWKSGIFTSRNAAYRWLARAMGLPPALTHVAMFDKQQCQKVIAVVQQFRQIAKSPVIK